MGVLFVYNDTYAGKCFWTEKRSRVTSIFSYDDSYLSDSDCWSISPDLKLISGSQQTTNGLPGSVRDAAPDRWGQTLIRHRHIRNSKNSGQKRRLSTGRTYILQNSRTDMINGTS